MLAMYFFAEVLTLDTELDKCWYGAKVCLIVGSKSDMYCYEQVMLCIKKAKDLSS